MRIATEIPGLDGLIDGGFEEGTTNLISGETGTCKSIFCMQFLYNRATKYKEKCYYITTEDGFESIHKQAEQFGWKLKESPLKEKFRIIKLEPYNIQSLNDMIGEINKNKVKRVVIDSISVFEMYVKEPFLIRKGLFSVIERLREQDIVAIMTAEIPVGSRMLSRLGIVEFMADSIIKLQYIQEAKVKRSMVVKKMRFSHHAEEVHPFFITNRGIVVK